MILREKRREETERKNMTLADIVRGQGNLPTQSMTPCYVKPDITREETLKINICVAHAHYRNLENPGTYGEELNKILTANKLPNDRIVKIMFYIHSERVKVLDL